MSKEIDPQLQLADITEIERHFRTLAASSGQPSDFDNVFAVLTKYKGEVTEKLIPPYVYINMKPVFTPVALTIPSLEIDIPENPSDKPDESGLVVKLRNNRRYEISERGQNGLRGRDWNLKTQIETVSVFGDTYSGEDVISRRPELLQAFFVHLLEGEDNVETMTTAMENAGLVKDSYLYRAITASDLSALRQDGTICYSHLDPSANFESENMFQNPNSQVRMFAPKSEDGYTGDIIRWKIEHPLLYRTAGMAAPRVVPLFSHYLPPVEISNDSGNIFTPFVKTS